MNIRHVFNTVLLFSVMSCVVELSESSPDDQRNAKKEDTAQPFDGYGPDGYPAPVHPNDWDCGTEIVKTEGPDGSIYLVEVPIPCDPRQDEYFGCPPENFVLPNEQTKQEK